MENIRSYEDNIKKLAADLWKQWKENELDE